MCKREHVCNWIKDRNVFFNRQNQDFLKREVEKEPFFGQMSKRLLGASDGQEKQVESHKNPNTNLFYLLVSILLKYLFSY